MPLTQKQVRLLISEKKPVTGRSDGGGLTVSLSKAGGLSWSLRRRIAGRLREFHLGKMTRVDEARKEA